MHINLLELKAALYAIQTFKGCFGFFNFRYNMTALSYVSKMGGPESRTLPSEQRDMELSVANRHITVTVEYLPAVLNVVTDHESRHVHDSSEWMLSPNIFHQVFLVLGVPDIAFCIESLLSGSKVVCLETGSLKYRK